MDWARPRRRRCVRLAAAGAALAAALAAPPAGATPDPPVHVDAVQDSGAAELSLDLMDDCGQPATTPVPDGHPIKVRLPPGPTFVVGSIPASVWRHPWQHDPSWRLHFEAFLYLPELAARAARDGSVLSLSTMVAQVAAFHDQNHDPGTSAYGWDQGTAQRRLQVENCLFATTHDNRLIPGMTADANVLLGARYYGPPRFPVHNHGLMANLRLIRAGQLLVDDAWVTKALTRMKAEAPLAFTAQGTTWEQSTQYHEVNVLLWNQAANTLGQWPAYQATANQIRANVAKAQEVFLRMTEPDGRLVQIGDSDRGRGGTGTLPAGLFRDDQAGLAIGRSSGDKGGTYYTLRYGPPQRAHGHLDRGGVTWSTLGGRVLVDVGRFGTDPTWPLARWQATRSAANVAILRHAKFRGYGAVRIAHATARATAQAWLIDDRQYRIQHLRDVNVNVKSHALTVKDTFAGRTDFSQQWHLDPVWKLVSRQPQRLVFRRSDGRTLTVVTNGVVTGLYHGSTRPLAGWTFPSQGRREAAYQFTISATTASLRTSFTVR
jgi:hypothetical protein